LTLRQQHHRRRVSTAIAVQDRRRLAPGLPPPWRRDRYRRGAEVVTAASLGPSPGHPRGARTPIAVRASTFAATRQHRHHCAMAPSPPRQHRYRRVSGPLPPRCQGCHRDDRTVTPATPGPSLPWYQDRHRCAQAPLPPHVSAAAAACQDRYRCDDGTVTPATPGPSPLWHQDHHRCTQASPPRVSTVCQDHYCCGATAGPSPLRRRIFIGLMGYFILYILLYY
jgi:hypothetical protein